MSAILKKLENLGTVGRKFLHVRKGYPCNDMVIVMHMYGNLSSVAY